MKIYTQKTHTGYLLTVWKINIRHEGQYIQLDILANSPIHWRLQLDIGQWSFEANTYSCYKLGVWTGNNWYSI